MWEADMEMGGSLFKPAGERGKLVNPYLKK
jgi:hypothetical protein